MDREMGLDGKRPSREQTLFSITWTVHCPLLEASSQVLPKTNDSLPPAAPPRPARFLTFSSLRPPRLLGCENRTVGDQVMFLVSSIRKQHKPA